MARTEANAYKHEAIRMGFREC